MPADLFPAVSFVKSVGIEAGTCAPGGLGAMFWANDFFGGILFSYAGAMAAKGVENPAQRMLAVLVSGNLLEEAPLPAASAILCW